ncbi:hypothetical protein [Pseudalkalibacillus berkeleyi]|uniref:Uncharacterized protein n=1 Tax=Pseudalkalibacillus berkeleyi TaxID=1069813 RepID=A0ABS9H3F8_9BACL|nr:hypothetical protein [Pseudalkalibacillus berkeleyi]MCF6138611.1 hypothetical protein [Pseudalkalibacillus berkeleyi]
MNMKRLLISCVVLLFIFPSSLYANSINVEYLPSIFDDGTQIPERIEWKSWDETSEIVPKDSVFEVVDYETGLYFKVQRRAGSKHADVQPLTTIDTAIMKAIYDGKWSWKRRAIFIRSGSHLIPASMHGMPHGAGALANNFPGHFCIHLPNSTTHSSSKEDPSHQLMILKAAGKLDQYLNKATSEQIAFAFINGINQEDNAIVRKTIRPAKNVRTLRKIFFINPDVPRFKQQPTSLMVVEYPVELTVRTRQGLTKEKAVLYLERESLTSRWYVNVAKSTL